MCSNESSHRDGSFEYPQHMFWSRNKKNIFNYALLSQGLSAVCALPGFTTGKKNIHRIIEEYESGEINLKTCHKILHWTV